MPLSQSCKEKLQLQPSSAALLLPLEGECQPERKSRCICKSEEQVIDNSGRPIFELFTFDDPRLLLGKQEIAFGLGNDSSCGRPPRSSDQNQSAKMTTLVAQIFVASNSSVLPAKARWGARWRAKRTQITNHISPQSAVICGGESLECKEQKL